MLSSDSSTTSTSYLGPPACVPLLLLVIVAFTATEYNFHYV